MKNKYVDCLINKYADKKAWIKKHKSIWKQNA